MTMTSDPTLTLTPLVTLDLYRDIHKGIRNELFAVTSEAGSVDPADRSGRTGVAEHVRTVVELLVSHAEHEDAAIQPTMELQLPTLAEKVAVDHATIDGRLVELQALADTAAEATRAEQRGWTHRLYLELASFTAAYLEHQDVEERVVMPALESAIGFESVLAIHQAIISNIPPDEMARSLGVMLPAMNLDDRAELLGGMQAEAPPEVFAGVWGLAGSVLAGPDHAALAARLGIEP
jgi:hypothetical protein